MDDQLCDPSGDRFGSSKHMAVCLPCFRAWAEHLPPATVDALVTFAEIADWIEVLAGGHHAKTDHHWTALVDAETRPGGAA